MRIFNATGEKLYQEWVLRFCAKETKTLRLATVFGGIGAIGNGFSLLGKTESWWLGRLIDFFAGGGGALGAKSVCHGGGVCGIILVIKG